MGERQIAPRRGLSIHVARITSVKFAVRIDEARRHRPTSVIFDPHRPLYVGSRRPRRKDAVMV